MEIVFAMQSLVKWLIKKFIPYNICTRIEKKARKGNDFFRTFITKSKIFAHYQSFLSYHIGLFAKLINFVTLNRLK